MSDDVEGDDGSGGKPDTSGSGSDDVGAEASEGRRTGVPAAMLAAEGAATDDDGDDDAPWYRSRFGLGLVGANLLFLLLLVFASAEGGPLGNVATGAGNTGLWGTTSTTGAGVPWYVYIFGAVGALGFVFTTLVVDFDQSAESLARMCLRIPAALPLAAGIYLLSEQMLGSDPPTELLAGLAFLAGLYVDLTYRRLDALARRLLPSSGDDSGTGTDDAEREAPDSKNGAGDADVESGHTESETSESGDEAAAVENDSQQENSHGSGTPG